MTSEVFFLAHSLHGMADMAYPRRVTPPGMVFHVLNRAAQRRRLFSQEGDYRAFLTCLAEAHQRIPVDIYAYCIMPNHFHLVMASREDGQISRFMALLTATHSKRWHGFRGSEGDGPVYQGRFKAFPVQTEHYFFTVCRYVEANALRAGLAPKAEEWPWSSISARRPADVVLTKWPLPRPADWLALVNRSDENLLEEVRPAVRLGRPFGSDTWRKSVSDELGLQSTLRPRGRPRKDL